MTDKEWVQTLIENMCGSLGGYVTSRTEPWENAISREAIYKAISKMEEASEKDKLCGGYPYQRCIDILKEVIKDETQP